MNIGRYDIVDRIREDETGEVFSAIDQTMARRVAIKVLLAPDEKNSEERRGRFYREAKVGSRLTHPNAITVLDLAEENGRPYIVMEPLRGIPLEQWLSTPAVDAQAALDARIEVMLQVCDVLQAAHEKGITHGDLKPASVFVQRDGGVKVLDFGSEPSRHTHGYVSPEQLMGRAADARSDLFSAAAMFYLMLKGRAPFSGPDAAAIRSSVLHTEPAALSASEAPEALARTVMKALSKNPDARHPSAALLRAEVAQVRSLKNGHHTRMVWAALDRYRRIEGLINERRGLGRRLGISNIDKSCDESFARLALRFPALARSGGEDALLPEVPFDQAADDLAQLQQIHNDELAEVAVLRTIDGGAAGQGFLDRASGFFSRWRPDSDTLEGSK